MNTKQIGFIGGGNMASSLIGGLVSNGYPADKLTVVDLDSEKLSYLNQTFGVNTLQDSKELATKADVLVLAIKPQHMQSVAQDLGQAIQDKSPVVVSIAAGIRVEALDRWLGGHLPIVRCMPNTPALVKTGATGLYANAQVTENQKDLVESLLRAVGVTVWVEEEHELDAVTALSGSGPAYFFMIMEALEAAGIKAGLSQKTAQLLTQETALGAAKMALESSEPASVLRQRVTSPGGTTERAIGILEEQGLRDILQAALLGAKERSIELSDELGNN
ncbi:pyrroline-5-carboxylate reductase [Cycloclasticus sp. P1]|uniref:pyrroline-5-carboxylate reductase n=1 Tax=Cycloclasticus sp. (strain P1) TaxID=385025 RepID=UPI000286A917|nr:pyrroline-5-carboxylate reductase [Cycloclasticus sp. P1]AFT66117.1 Pyrroline-5-carboxylate reductase [Cycloclasticus sp. P1]